MNDSIVVILLFALTFAFIGWASPVLYATYAEDDSFMVHHSFEAQNVSTDADSHYVCFNRTVKNPSSGRVFTELYLIDESERRTEVGSKTMQRYFDEGQQTVITELELPDQLEPGQYKYILVVRMELADGRVYRNFVVESETFSVQEGKAKSEDPLQMC